MLFVVVTCAVAFVFFLWIFAVTVFHSVFFARVYAFFALKYSLFCCYAQFSIINLIFVRIFAYSHSINIYYFCKFPFHRPDNTPAVHTNAMRSAPAIMSTTPEAQWRCTDDDLINILFTLREYNLNYTKRALAHNKKK